MFNELRLTRGGYILVRYLLEVVDFHFTSNGPNLAGSSSRLTNIS